mgnify:CR=1 FL=1|jgi:hypothetical protein
MEDTDKHKSLCGAKTRTGHACRKPALKRKRRCRLHGGASTGPKTAEGRARIAAAQLKHGRYVNWRERREKEKAYFRQIRMVMAQAIEAGLIKD